MQVDNLALNHEHCSHEEDLAGPRFTLALSPSGRLYLYPSEDGQGIPESAATGLRDKIYPLFPKEGGNGQSSHVGLLRLGILRFPFPLPDTFLFWQTFGQLFVTEVCKASGANEGFIGASFHVSPPLAELASLIGQAPFMRGSEYLTVERMGSLWQGLSDALKEEVSSFEGNLQQYLSSHNSLWNKVGRVCFHLAENKANPEYPFAFLATYTARLSATASSLQHLPLEQALKEYAGEHKRSHLLSLLIPVQKAAEQSSFIKALVDSGGVFKPLSWTAKEAHAFLKSIPLLEAAGVMVRVPNWWRPKHPPRPQVTVAIGNAATNAVGLTALLDFNMAFCLPDGEELDGAELESLLGSQESLVQIRGQWVEVDPEKVSQVLAHWRQIARQVKNDGLSFAEGLRLLAGASGHSTTTSVSEDVAEWSKVIEGPWLQDTLTRLRHPDQPSYQEGDRIKATLDSHLRADLRPYQYLGVQWLWLLYNLKLGGCLADDMGLGKTIQVLSLFLLVKYQNPEQKKKHLLVLPASLLGNWQAEIRKFAPTLKVLVAHSSGQDKFKEGFACSASEGLDVDIVITTYGNVYRLPWIGETPWDMVILDEAQSVKNPTTKQTLAVKALPSQVRFVLTGTPVENRLLDLWSLFDFIAPGLLGSSKAFSGYGKKAQDGKGEHHFYAAIRHLVAPYILRRLKGDKRIISDLPDKTELDAWCFLTKQQVGLYQKSVEELERQLNEAGDDMKRRGLVLSYLIRFKQICNHPNQWLGHGGYREQGSGKFMRLKELCAPIAERQEKVLVFTQFREIIPALHEVLEGVFGRSGLILHGQTPIRERAGLVEAFQQEQGAPFFILSLKAGGTGLNLTNASHVIHFDRWWNPAVENQATDRAYRIGQKKNVLVHKFICQGTVEEKIDALIKAKKTLAEDILNKEGEVSLTEMSNDDLIKMVSLDIHKAFDTSV